MYILDCLSFFASCVIKIWFRKLFHIVIEVVYNLLKDVMSAHKLPILTSYNIQQRVTLEVHIHQSNVLLLIDSAHYVFKNLTVYQENFDLILMSLLPLNANLTCDVPSMMFYVFMYSLHKHLISIKLNCLCVDMDW